MQEVLKSYGGSVWQMVLEPSHTPYGGKAVTSSPEQSSSLSTDSDSSSDDDENSGSEDEEALLGEQVALGCDDGCVRLFTVKDGESFVYKKSFPRVQGTCQKCSLAVKGYMDVNSYQVMLLFGYKQVES